MTELAGRRVLVVGLGTSGFATARVLAARGAVVRATDSTSSPQVVERAGLLPRPEAKVAVS